MTPTSKPAVTPEMVEQREIHCSRCGEILHKGPEDYTVLHVVPCMNCINELRVSAVQDAVRDCATKAARQFSGVGGDRFAAAMREKYGVKP